MKQLAILICLGLLLGCADTKDKQDTPLIGAISAIQANQPPKQNLAPQILNEAKALIDRADSEGYKLITPLDLQAHFDEFVIIATLPRGIYNLGLIPNAKHFEFQPTQENWESDALGRPQEEFLHLLGYNKQAKIVFYDEGSEYLINTGRARTGITWAKELGFANVYYLVGGMKMWKKKGLPISTQAPSCCEM